MRNLPDSITGLLKARKPLDYKYGRRLGGVARSLRQIYLEVHPEANQYPFNHASLDWEAEAHYRFGRIVQSDPSFQRMAKTWNSLNNTERLENLKLLADACCRVLLQALSEQSSGGHDAVLIFKESLKRQYLDIRLVPWAKSIAFHHIAGEEWYDADENHVLLPVSDNENPIDTFEGALEVAAYTGARVCQTRLARLAFVLKSNHPDFLKARLFLLADDITAYENDRGVFAWRPEEFEEWLSQPVYRHAFSAVNNVLSAYKMKTHGVSEGFLKGWRESFLQECIQTVIFDHDIPTFDKKTKSSPRLDRLQQIISCAPDLKFETLSDEIKRNLLRLLDECKKYTLLDIQILKIKNWVEESQIVLCKPDPVGPSLIKMVGGLDAESILSMKGLARVEYIRSLFNAAAESPEQAATAHHLAWRLAQSCDAYKSIEPYEDECIFKLHDFIKGHPEFRRVKANWPLIDFDTKFSHLHDLAKIQARIFGFTPVQEVTSFNLSRAEHARLVAEGKDTGVFPAAFALDRSGGWFGLKPVRKDWEYPGFNPVAEITVAFNIHSDGCVLGDYDQSVLKLLHEQNHIQQNECDLRVHNKDFKSDHIYARFSSMNFHAFSRNDIQDENLHRRFYLAAMAERHSRAIEAKFSALQNGYGRMPCEQEVFAYEMLRYG